MTALYMAKRCQHGAEEHSMTLGVRKMKLLGVAVAALLAMGASGCSSLPSVPDWVDPTSWFGSDEPADNTATPDLASVPDKPAATTPDEQQKVAESLAGDRTNAKYGAEALRGGTEPAATPPADVVPAPAAEAPVVAKAKAPARVSSLEACWEAFCKKNPDQLREPLAEMWFAMIARMFPGKDQADLTPEEWGSILTDITGTPF